jgi:hypothetical protein
MSIAAVESPKGRRSMYRVVTKDGYYVCDSGEIAYELAKRLNARRAPGWVARDLRQSQ